MRNPRPAYTADGAEIPPLTLADMRGLGVRTIDAYCECGHGAHGISVETLPDDVPVPDLALRLRCSACGSKNVRSRPNWTEYRAVGHGIAGTGSHAFPGVGRILDLEPRATPPGQVGCGQLFRQARAGKAEERATAAEAQARASEKSAQERLARLRDVLGE